MKQPPNYVQRSWGTQVEAIDPPLAISAFSDTTDMSVRSAVEHPHIHVRDVGSIQAVQQEQVPMVEFVVVVDVARVLSRVRGYVDVFWR